MTQAPLTLVNMNIVYAVSSYSAGGGRRPREQASSPGSARWRPDDRRSDTRLRRKCALAVTGVALWVLHMGLTQRLQSTLGADAAPPDLRGTAFGIVTTVSGGFLLHASVIAGALWMRYGPYATFVAEASFSAITLIALLHHHRRS